MGREEIYISFQILYSRIIIFGLIHQSLSYYVFSPKKLVSHVLMVSSSGPVTAGLRIFGLRMLDDTWHMHVLKVFSVAETGIQE